MKDKRTGRQALRNIVMSAMVILFFVSIIILYYIRLHSETSENIIKSGELNAVSCADTINKYLSTGIDFTAAVIDTACGRAPDLTPKRAPGRASVRFIFTEADRAAFEAVRAAAPDTLWRWSCDDGDLGRDVTDSSNRHGWWITAEPAAE